MSSDITVVLTSCGRFDLLAKTLESFFIFNTYPIGEFIIIEDSGKANVSDIEGCIPKISPIAKIGKTTIIINESCLGQLRSIDKAYGLVKTGYVFHCEDDWQFYRPNFIEESKQILEENGNIFSVWLRDFHHDFGERCKYISLGEREKCDDIPYYRVYSERKNNECFSFNPGLRRYSEYPEGGYMLLMKDKKDLEILEFIISYFYDAKGMYSVLLENSAVKHIGWKRHIAPLKVRLKKRHKKIFNYILSIVIFIFGIFIGSIGEL